MASVITGLACKHCGASEGSDFCSVAAFPDQTKLCPTCRATLAAERRLEMSSSDLLEETRARRS